MILIFRKFFANDLIRHTGVIFLGTMVAHICNLLYQMIVSRLLPAREYTLLAAFLGVLAIIQLPLVTLTTTLSHYSSLIAGEGRIGDLKRLLRKWLVLTGVPALVLSIVALLFNASFAAFFHLDRADPVLIAAITLPALFFLPVLNGVAQGIQRFGWISVSTIGGALARLCLGAGFVWLIHPACGWAMLGHGVGVYVSAALLFTGLLFVLVRVPTTNTTLPSMRFYLLQSFFVQAAYAVLMTADVILVKHFLPDDPDFAYAATLGRVAVFLPGAIVIAMFPKVTSPKTVSVEQKSVFLKALLYTAMCVAVTIVVCFLFPQLLARILFGISDASVMLKRMIFLMAVVMGISSLLNVVVQFLLAQRRFNSGFVVVACAVLYLISVSFFHESAREIILIAGGCNAIALVVTLLFAVRLNPESV